MAGTPEFHYQGIILSSNFIPLSKSTSTIIVERIVPNQTNIHTNVASKKVLKLSMKLVKFLTPNSLAPSLGLEYSSFRA